MSGRSGVTTADRELLAEAQAARERAYAPYSRFCVGAAVRTRGGRVYPGCNVENATSGLTLCAERVAIFSALSDDEEIDAIAVSVREGTPALPCGICRELIRQRAPHARLVLADGDGRAVIATLDELLPEIT